MIAAAPSLPVSLRVLVVAAADEAVAAGLYAFEHLDLFDELARRPSRESVRR
jgi:hypothetical protein